MATSPAPSTDRPRTRLFIVGCSRSGTTWLQHLLQAHPRVATMRETHLYTKFLQGLREAYRRDREDANHDYGVGVAAQVDRETFAALTGAYAAALVEHMASDAEDADVLLEKSPEHVFVVDWIRELHPDARFVHIIRDPRAVAASLMAAAKTWGSHWAPESAAEAAAMWCTWVRAGRRVETMGDTARTLRYEALHERGPEELLALFAWLGLEADDALCKEIVEQSAFERMQRAEGSTSMTPRLPPGEFFRKGEAEGWRDELQAEDVADVERVAWDLMRDLGYEPAHATKPEAPATPAPAKGLRRTLGGWLVRAGKELGRLGRRVEGPDERDGQAGR